MSYFQSSAELQEVLGGFFDRLFSDPVIGPKLKSANPSSAARSTWRCTAPARWKATARAAAST